MNENTITVLVVLIAVVVTVITTIIKIVSFENVQKNCHRCGKPFTHWKGVYEALCSTCQKKYDRAIEEVIKSWPKIETCCACAGSGKVKGYKCVQCSGRGSIPRIIKIDNTTKEAARVSLSCNPEWRDLLDKYGNVK